MKTKHTIRAFTFLGCITVLLLSSTMYSKDPPPGCVNCCKNITVNKITDAKTCAIFEESDCLVCSNSGGCIDGISGDPDDCTSKFTTKVVTYYVGGTVLCSGGGAGNRVEA
jgi:hypothetical protein